MERPISGEQLAALKAIATCDVANAIESFGVRLRNQGFTNQSIRCCVHASHPVVGYAATVRIHCSNPRKDGHPYGDRTDWWNYLLTLPAPRVVVIQDVDEAPGTGSIIGEVHAAILQALGCVAVVTNGTVRDVPGITARGIPVFASGLAVSHAYSHIVDFGGPVVVGGLPIQPGDLLHADLHGVLSIPPEIAGEIPAVAARIAERERRVMALCASSHFSPEVLRAAVSDVFD